MKAFADLADLPEDDRIRVIGETAERGERVGFFVDDDAKADRYIKKLLKWYPRVEVVERKRDLLVNNTVFVAVNRRADG
jgi:hypothetical protein